MAQPSWQWKKSSYSQGTSNCVEVGLREWPWKKSKYSTHSNCVETKSAGGAVMVRDTKDRSIPAIAVAPEAWETFLSTLR